MAPTLISGLDELYNCPFYWGKIEQKEAESILKEKPVGSYLVTDAEDENKDHQLELFFVKNSSIIGKSELQFGLDFAASTGDWNFYIVCGRQSFMEFLRKHYRISRPCISSLEKKTFFITRISQINYSKNCCGRPFI